MSDRSVPWFGGAKVRRGLSFEEPYTSLKSDFKLNLYRDSTGNVMSFKIRNEYVCLELLWLDIVRETVRCIVPPVKRLSA